MTAVFGYSAQCGIDTNNPVQVRFDFESSDLGLTEEFLDTDGLRGTRSRSIERQRQGIRRCHGNIKLQPTAVELALLLPWIFGGSPSGSGTITYPLADALTTRFITIDKGFKVATYNGCVVDRAVFHASQGQPLSVDLSVVGIDETLGSSGSFPSLTIDTTTPPFIFTDLVLSIASTSYSAKDVSISIDNVIEKERFFNSQVLTAGYAKDRHVKIQHSLPYGDAGATYTATGVSGVAVVATWTDGTYVLTMTMANVAYPRVSPHVTGRDEVMLTLPGTCLKAGTSTLELVTTLVS